MKVISSIRELYENPTDEMSYETVENVSEGASAEIAVLHAHAH